MKNKVFYTLLLMIAGIFFVSCSDNDDSNPFNEHSKGEFNPTEIEFLKKSDNMEIIEKWSDIERDNRNRITAYSYTREVKGNINEKETRVCKIDYFTNHQGNDVIRANTNVEFFKSNNGIDAQYTEKVLENISINREGHIESIETTTDRFNLNAEKESTTTSQRTFTYKNELCTGSVYNDENTQITYNYNWNAYQLKNITVLRENRKDNTTEYNTYDYTFDKKEYYRYSSAEILPFVQSGFPQIYASMGYLGKFTPYILTAEVQGGYTKFAGITSENPQIRNSYSFEVVENNKKLTMLGASNIYNAYSVTFSK